MNAYLKKTWWEYLLLALFCTAVPLLLGTFGLPLLNNTPWVIWYLVAMPILCSVMITMVSRKLGKFDWAALIAMELLLMLFAFIMNGFSFSSADFPLHYALLLLSIPALLTLLIGGIAYSATAKNKK